MCYGHRMELADHEIERFIRAWKQDFGETLSNDAARAELSRLLIFLRLLSEASHHSNRPTGGGSSSRGTIAP